MSVAGKKVAGFTLIEVMVALAIVAVALPALLTLTGTQLTGAASLREKTYAYWVAENELTRIKLRQQYFPTERLAESESGTSELAGHQWRWQLTSETTDIEKFYRVEISVSLQQGSPLDKAQPLAVITGFISEP